MEKNDHNLCKGTGSTASCKISVYCILEKFKMTGLVLDKRRYENVTF